jgi:hypothetical protein
MKKATSVTVLEKSFHEADTSNYEYQSSFVVLLQYHNLSDRPIKAFKGGLEFYDQFGSRITGFAIEWQHPLGPGAITTERMSYDYNQFMQGDNKLRETPLRDLKTKWEPSMVIFADGSSLKKSE